MNDKQKILCSLGLGLISLLSCSELLAKPHGMKVKSGNATMETISPTEMKIHVGNKTILHWEDFSIAEREQLIFAFSQPGKHAAVLNRVSLESGNMSKLLGTLKADGKVFLINPNGILIGKNALIDVKGFVASTLDILDNQFLEGDTINFNIGNSKNSIINSGVIKALEGDVLFIARHIQNEGIIEAPQGVVEFGAGKDVLFQLKDGYSHIYVRQQGGKQSKVGTGIDNSGKISAMDVKLDADGGLYSMAIKDAGQIEARGRETVGGRVFLVSDAGKIEKSGSIKARKEDGSGGRVEMKAQTVLVQKATLDVSSESGDGGRVVLQGKERLAISGQVKARANGATGNGGHVVLSSQGVLDFQAQVDTTAASLQTGDLFLYAPSIRVALDKSTQFTTVAPNFFQKALQYNNLHVHAEGKDPSITFVEGIKWDSSKTAKTPTSLFLNAEKNIFVGTEKSTGPVFIISDSPSSEKEVISLEAPHINLGDKGGRIKTIIQAKTGDIQFTTTYLTVQGGIGDKDTSSRICITEKGNVRIDAFPQSPLHILVQGGDSPISVAEIVSTLGNISINKQQRATGGSVRIIGGNGDTSSAWIATFKGGNIESLLPSNSSYILQGGKSQNVGFAQIVAASGEGAKGSVKLHGGDLSLISGTGAGNVQARISGDIENKNEDAVSLKINGKLYLAGGNSDSKDGRAIIQALGGGKCSFETDAHGKMDISLLGGSGSYSPAMIETKNGGGIYINSKNLAGYSRLCVGGGSGKDSFAAFSASQGGDVIINLPATADISVKGGNGTYVLPKGEESSSLLSSAYIFTKEGQISLSGNKIMFLGGEGAGNSNTAQVINENGKITLHAHDDVLIASGTSNGGDAAIRSAGELRIHSEGNIVVEGKGNASAILQSYGPAHLEAKKTITFRTEGNGKAGLQNVLNKVPGNGDIVLKAYHDIFLYGTSVIQNLQGKIILESDHSMRMGNAFLKSNEGIIMAADLQRYKSGVSKFGIVAPEADFDSPNIAVYSSDPRLNSLPQYVASSSARYIKSEYETFGVRYNRDAPMPKGLNIHYYESESELEGATSTVGNLAGVLNSQLFYNLYNQYDTIWHGRVEYTLLDPTYSPYRESYGIKRKTNRFMFTYDLVGDN